MRVIGLMSGTSADGVDAALVEITGAGERKRLGLKAFRVYPFPRGVRDAIYRASHPRTGDVASICALNARLGEIFARAALSIARDASLSMAKIHLIGSHGQTIHHMPRQGCTLQIGEPSIIAERTGVTTIADFRPRDMAAGGHGAPLTPFLHDFLFREPGRARAVHNIGGISNVTVLPPGEKEKILAFDTGPGNMVIDAIVRKATGRHYDAGGRMARAGRPDRRILHTLLSMPFFRRRPPKTTGREEFGIHLADIIWAEGRRRRLAAADMAATATAFTAESIARAYKKFILPRWDIEEIIAGGGGVRNHALMDMIRALLPGVPVVTFEKYGLNSDAVEAMAFALLAYETHAGYPNNIPSATGAARSVILGKIIPGRPAGRGPA